MLMVNPGVLIVLRDIRAIFVKGKKIICGKLLVCIVLLIALDLYHLFRDQSIDTRVLHVILVDIE